MTGGEVPPLGVVCWVGSNRSLNVLAEAEAVRGFWLRAVAADLERAGAGAG